MISERTFKYLLIIGVSTFILWLGATDETALGLMPSDLHRHFAPPLFIFFFLLGPIVFKLFYAFPYLIITGAAGFLIGSSVKKDRWTWSPTRISVVLSGAASACSLLTEIGQPLLLSISVTLIVNVALRSKNLPMRRWIDAFSKVEITFLTIAVIWLSPDWHWNRFVPKDWFFQTAADVPPYATQYERQMDAASMDAAARFPDPQSCLVDGNAQPNFPDALQIDWAKIHHASEAEVCIFRLLSALGGIEAYASFMEAQGFSEQSSRNPENPYVDPRDGSLRVSSSWSIRDNGPKFPTHGIIARILSSTPNSMLVSVNFSQDGENVLWVSIDNLTV